MKPTLTIIDDGPKDAAVEWDGMVFRQYNDRKGEYQALVESDRGTISVRVGRTVLADENRPYEVFYPTDDDPCGYQTAEDIRRYVAGDDDPEERFARWVDYMNESLSTK